MQHVVTPFDSSVQLFLVESENDATNIKEYANIIGSLRYVTDYTRLDIAYAVGLLGRFTRKSRNKHCHVVTIIMRYLIGTKNCGCSIKNILLYLKAFVIQIGTLYEVIHILPLIMSLL